jgi:hypothetical protein
MGRIAVAISHGAGGRMTTRVFTMTDFVPGQFAGCSRENVSFRMKRRTK